mmetsp:Transcript_4264/g.13768  ORF Transcript_4264/g.13768 Transcript_4264/m.13768 type:complete len:269 (-) Transcript_4264:285-1091(-)
MCRTPASRSCARYGAALCGWELKTVLRQPESASTWWRCCFSSTRWSEWRVQGWPQSLYELPLERVRANTQCSVWKMGTCAWTITSMRERSEGGSADKRAQSWSASRSNVGAKRATPSSRYACAAAALATLSEKSAWIRGSVAPSSSASSASLESSPAPRTRIASAPSSCSSTRQRASSAGLMILGAATTVAFGRAAASPSRTPSSSRKSMTISSTAAHAAAAATCSCVRQSTDKWGLVLPPPPPPRERKLVVGPSGGASVLKPRFCPK